MQPSDRSRCGPFPRLRCVIFDLDGTLAQTSDLIFASFNHIMGRHLGRELPPEEIVALFGPPEEGAIAKVFGEEAIPSLMDELCDYYEVHHDATASLHDGILDLLEYLRRRGVALAVFTGKGRRTTTITLARLGLAPFFDVVVTGNDVRRHKPDPEGIRRAMDALGVGPDETLMVGDSLSDVKAASGAGVRIASVLWDSFDHERVLRDNGACVFHSVEAFFRWLREQLETGAPHRVAES